MLITVTVRSWPLTFFDQISLLKNDKNKPIESVHVTPDKTMRIFKCVTILFKRFL